jgi:hypothetical protein
MILVNEWNFSSSTRRQVDAGAESLNQHLVLLIDSMGRVGWCCRVASSYKDFSAWEKVSAPWKILCLCFLNLPSFHR